MGTRVRGGPGTGADVFTAFSGPLIDPAATYRVAMNSFLAGGGDSFAELGKGTNVLVGGDDLAAFEACPTANSSAATPYPVPAADRITVVQ